MDVGGGTSKAVTSDPESKSVVQPKSESVCECRFEGGREGAREGGKEAGRQAGIAGVGGRDGGREARAESLGGRGRLS